MASAPVEEPSHTLQYQTWNLKVSIHCQGCKTKVKKVLQSIEGVYTVNIDAQQQKVTVIGKIDAQTLLRKLMKTGKHAEMWPEKAAAGGKDKKGGKQNGNNKDGDSKSTDDSDEDQEENPAESVKNTPNGTGKVVKFQGIDGKSPGNVPSTGEKPPVSDQKSNINNGGAAEKNAGTGGKKKKKKGKKGNTSNNNATSASIVAPSGTGLEAPKMGSVQVVGQINPNPSNQHMYQYPPSYGPYQASVVSYNAAQPSITAGPMWYMPASPYIYAFSQSEVYPENYGSSLNTFEILSDENPNACFIM